MVTVEMAPRPEVSASVVKRHGPGVLVALHFAIVVLTGRAGTEHWCVDLLFLALWTIGSRTRLAAWALLPLWAIAITYWDLLPPALSLRGDVHVSDLYAAELRWFGVQTTSGRAVPCDLFRETYWAPVDLICGPAYLAHQVPIVLLSAYFFLRDRRQFRRFALALLVMHVASYATYVVYPAAPPWYVEIHGLGPAVPDPMPDPAGVARLDELLGFGLSKAYYGKSVNVYGAMPSLHVGLAWLYVLVVRHKGPRWLIPASVFAGLIAFGAVYFRHHYVLDIVAGTVYAAAAYLAAGVAMRRSPEPGRIEGTGAAGCRL